MGSGGSGAAGLPTPAAFLAAFPDLLVGGVVCVF